MLQERDWGQNLPPKLEVDGDEKEGSRERQIKRTHPKEQDRDNKGEGGPEGVNRTPSPTEQEKENKKSLGRWEWTKGQDLTDAHTIDSQRDVQEEVDKSAWSFN